MYVMEKDRSDMDCTTEISILGSNYYGGLIVGMSGGQHFAGIVNWDEECLWHQIPEALYAQIVEFQTAGEETGT